MYQKYGLQPFPRDSNKRLAAKLDDRNNKKLFTICLLMVN